MSKTALPELASIAVLSPCVTRILALNPGSFTLQGTNTYLIGHPQSRERLLVDTGEGLPEYASLLGRYLETTGQSIGAILLTHWHGDHIGGVPSVISALGYTPPVFKYRNPYRPEPETWAHVGDDEVLEYGGVTVRTLHTPGHAPDHLCLWLEEESALFSADNVLGHGTTVFDDYAAYIRSLKRMAALPNLSRVYPGHGQVIADGPGKIAEYIQHRAAREQQVMDILKKQSRPVTSMEITELIYSNQPPEVLSAANRGVMLYLAKLEEDGAASNTGIDWVAKSNL